VVTVNGTEHVWDLLPRNQRDPTPDDDAAGTAEGKSGN
jgi:hypothetical protein